MAKTFNIEQQTQIGSIVAAEIQKAINPAPVQPVQPQAVNISDPLTNAYDDAEANIVKGLGDVHEMPIFIRNKRGKGQWFFNSVQKMNALRDARSDRNGFMGGVNKT